jgi:two-component system response regulator ChvI
MNSKNKPLIALVDDDRNILMSMEELLKKEDFNIHTYSDGQSALNSFFKHPPDIAVIDIKMPRMDGYELFKRIREKLTIPVIFLTSKDKEIDRLKGLMHGVDNYVTKGGNLTIQILIETIKNTLKTIQTISEKNEKSKIIVHNELRLDTERQECEWKEILLHDPLTTTEFKIIHELVVRPGIVKTRERLMDIAYKDEIDVDDRTIDSHVKRIRKKFKKIDPEFNSIHTLYGSGYQWK